ncbi:glycosyltransferase [Paraburkholderia sp. GAS32]|jgi:putative colanic acid biosynthesis glycosyltransferase|uniref:glycosyltransferase n=1 Tax=Paraburkholderia sp. GAS32 TaxID=3035129 RepID=UPI003D19E9B1
MLISIITVCWNDAAGLLRTMQSLQAQSSQSFEWIVVDGDSTDGTKELIESNPGISRYISELDNGIYDAMWKGVEIATGEFVWFLNAGDELDSADAVFSVKGKLREADMLLCDARFMVGSLPIAVRRARNFYESIWHSVPANQQATLYRRSLLAKEYFLHPFSICGDFFLAAHLARKGVKVDYLNSVVAKFYVGGVSTIKIMPLIRQAYLIQRDVLELGYFRRVISASRRFIACSFTLCQYLRMRRNT